MNGKSILLVDDEVDFVFLTGEFLKSQQYRVSIAYTGAEALLQSEKRPDLILLDRGLPDMDGLDICQKIRADQRLSHIPIIIVSAYELPPGSADDPYSGADDYVNKPFEREELLSRIRAILAKEPRQ